MLGVSTKQTVLAICGRVCASALTWLTRAAMALIYKVYHAGGRPGESAWNWLSGSSVVSLEWAGPGVGGGIIFPFSVSVSLALEFLLSDVLIGVLVGGFLLDGGGWSGGDEGEDSGEFHFALLKICYKNLLNITFYSVNYIKSIDFEYSQFIC